MFYNILGQAKSAVDAHPLHDLSLGHRRLIWSILGPRTDPSVTPHVSDGYKRRVTLAIATMRKVLPRWEASFPDDRSPHQALQMAENLFASKCSRDDAYSMWASLDYHYDDCMCKQIEPWYVFGVGYGCVQALKTVIMDEHFYDNNFDLNLNDGDVDSDELDSSYHAALAWAEGNVWSPESDRAKRREFWLWWLDEAVPNAWDAF
jgi:hypothetical protein